MPEFALPETGSVSPLVIENKTGGSFPLVVRLFSPGTDQTEIYRLRYRAYREAGWIGPRADEQLRDETDRLLSTVNFAAFRNGDCVGALRLAMSGDARDCIALPCAAEFPDEVAELKRLGHSRLVEFSRLALEPDLANRFFRTTLLASLVRAGLIVCYAVPVDFALLAVHAKLSRFYRSAFGFRLLGQSDSYIDIGEPTHLLGRAFQALDSQRRQRSGYFDISPGEIENVRAALDAMVPA